MTNEEKLLEQLKHYRRIAFNNQTEFIKKFGRGAKGTLRRFGLGEIELYFTVKGIMYESHQTMLTSPFLEWANNIDEGKNNQSTKK